MELAADRPIGSPLSAVSEINKTSRRIEFFWLCDECKTELTLIFREGIGVTTVPLVRTQLAAAS